MVIRLDPGMDVETARALLELGRAEVDAEAAVEEAAMDLAHRRLMREPRPRSGPQPRCPACCRFKSSAKDECSCGYWPGQGYAA